MNVPAGHIYDSASRYMSENVILINSEFGDGNYNPIDPKIRRHYQKPNQATKCLYGIVNSMSMQFQSLK